MAERKWYEYKSPTWEEVRLEQMQRLYDKANYDKAKRLRAQGRTQEQIDRARLTRPPWVQGQHSTGTALPFTRGPFSPNYNLHKYIPQGVTGPHWSEAHALDEFNRARESMGETAPARGRRGIANPGSTRTVYPSDLEVLDRYWGEVPNPYWRSFRQNNEEAEKRGIISSVASTDVDSPAVDNTVDADEYVDPLELTINDQRNKEVLELAEAGSKLTTASTPTDVADATDAVKTIEGLWTSSDADLVSTEERRKQYKEDMSNIFTKAMMLKVLGNLSGNDGEDMSKMFMQFAFEKMDKNKEFAGEDRLKKIRDKVMYREGPKGELIFDPPQFRREGYERVVAVGGNAKDAAAIFGHLQQKRQPTEYKRSDLVAFHRGPMADGNYEEKNFRPDEEPPKVSPPWIRGRKPTTPRAHNKAQYIAGLDNRVKKGETPETIIPWIRRQIGVGRRELDRVIDDEASLLVASLRDYANAMRQHNRPASELPAFITAMTKLGITLDEQKDIMAKAGLIAAQ